MTCYDWLNVCGGGCSSLVLMYDGGPYLGMYFAAVWPVWSMVVGGSSPQSFWHKARQMGPGRWHCIIPSDIWAKGLPLLIDALTPWQPPSPIAHSSFSIRQPLSAWSLTAQWSTSHEAQRSSEGWIPILQMSLEASPMHQNVSEYGRITLKMYHNAPKMSYKSSWNFHINLAQSSMEYSQNIYKICPNYMWDACKTFAKIA